MTYPRYVLSRNHKHIIRATGSDMILGAAISTVTELATATNGPGTGGFDLTLQAQAGDVIEASMNFLINNVNCTVVMDVYTMPGGVQTNPFGSGIAAGSTSGFMGWYGIASLEHVVSATARRALVSGDLDTTSGGTFVTLRPYYMKLTGTNRTIYSQANYNFNFAVRNIGPVDPN